MSAPRFTDMETAEAAAGSRRDRKSLRQWSPRALRRQSPTDRAFERLYSEYVTEVYQYALALLANPADAEDVTQQTFLNAYRAFHKGDRPELPHNWLIKIAHNVCRMRWRQLSRRPQEVPLELVREASASDGEKPTVEEILRALGTLPFNQRAALVMREIEGRSYAEIAATLGTSVPSVEALLFRARRRLQTRRKALGVLSTVPLPGSLSNFFGHGGVGIAAVGGGALGADVLLKTAAVVATGIVATGAGLHRLQGAADSSRPPSVPQMKIFAAPDFAAELVRHVVQADRWATPSRTVLQQLLHPRAAGAFLRAGYGRQQGANSPAPVPAGSTEAGAGSSSSASAGNPVSTVSAAVGSLPVKTPSAPLPSLPAAPGLPGASPPAPVVTPPVVTPPVVTPPVVAPPVVAPPVVTLPVVKPPAVRPPAVSPPAVSPPAVSLPVTVKVPLHLP